jgi:hypothetical protein
MCDIRLRVKRQLGPTRCHRNIPFLASQHLGKIPVVTSTPEALRLSMSLNAISMDARSRARAVADQARLRGLNGVIAPANQGNTNFALFPDDPNAPGSGGARLRNGLTYLDQQDFAGRGTPTSYRAAGVAPPPVDVTPNRSSPVADISTYTDKVTADADAHSRVSGARYTTSRIFVFYHVPHGLRVVHEHDRFDMSGIRIEVKYVGAIERDVRAVLQ